jgi:ABC-type ATPase with predicted acetyltransferase domain
MMALVESTSSARLTIILADEFAATLDRLTARIIASNLRRWVSRCTQPTCVLVASSHDDLLEPHPDPLRLRTGH